MRTEDLSDPKNHYYWGNLYDLLKSNPKYNTGDWWAEMIYWLEKFFFDNKITFFGTNQSRSWKLNEMTKQWECFGHINTVSYGEKNVKIDFVNEVPYK